MCVPVCVSVLHVYVQVVCTCLRMCIHRCWYVHVCVPMNANVGVCLCVGVHMYVWAYVRFISAPRMCSQCSPSEPRFEVNARAQLGKCWQWEIKPPVC